MIQGNVSLSGFGFWTGECNLFANNFVCGNRSVGDPLLRELACLHTYVWNRFGWMYASHRSPFDSLDTRTVGPHPRFTKLSGPCDSSETHLALSGSMWSHMHQYQRHTCLLPIYFEVWSRRSRHYRGSGWDAGPPPLVGRSTNLILFVRPLV